MIPYIKPVVLAEDVDRAGHRRRFAQPQRNQHASLQVDLTGDPVREGRNEPVAPSIRDRMQRVVENQWDATAEMTQTSRRGYEIASQQFGKTLEGLRGTVEALHHLESDAEAAGAPWTPGRVPVWQPE